MEQAVLNYLQGMGWQAPVYLGVVLSILFIWSLLWKGLALWRAAKRGEKIWFVVFLIVNTAGILEIIYLFLITKAKISDLVPGGNRTQ